MALSLGVTKGSSIQVGGSIIEVVDVLHGTHVQVVIGQQKFLITDCERTEVLPNVFLSCGVSEEKSFGSFSRIAIEAPKEVKIRRIGGQNDHRKP